jgi:hypothetical protein
MSGNGDDCQTQAWERVEAKLDRLSERVEDLAEEQGRHGALLAGHGELLAQQGELLGQQGRLIALVERRVSRVEGDLDLVKLTVEMLRHEIDRKLERLKDELVSALGRETRVELLAAQSLNDERVAALERRVAALESKS